MLDDAAVDAPSAIVELGGGRVGLPDQIRVKESADQKGTLTFLYADFLVGRLSQAFLSLAGLHFRSSLHQTFTLSQSPFLSRSAFPLVL